MTTLTNTLPAHATQQTPQRSDAYVQAHDAAPNDARAAALRWITCGSVDDGKSTLIGRLLLDSQSVLQDQLAGVQRSSAQGLTPDLALLTDGLSAEREQGITIDVAWRYFATPVRKFILGDTPGHEQYTRNMVTAASNADAAVVLVDATKLPWASNSGREANHAPLKHELLAQTRRHALLVHLLGVPSIVFAVNKLDAVADPALSLRRIRAAIERFALQAGLRVHAVVPISALQGYNVVSPRGGWADYAGPSLLTLLEQLPTLQPRSDAALAFAVQAVESHASLADTSQGRRILWGQVAAGCAQVGAAVQLAPGGQRAQVAQVLSSTRQPGAVSAGHGAGLVLDRELDVSRGDWLLAAASTAGDSAEHSGSPSRDLRATLAWLDDEPLTLGRSYWALHGHRWVKARVRRIVHRLNIHDLTQQEASELTTNEIGQVELQLQEALPTAPYAHNRMLGAMILVDSASHKTAAAVMLN